MFKIVNRVPNVFAVHSVYSTLNKAALQLVTEPALLLQHGNKKELTFLAHENSIYK